MVEENKQELTDVEQRAAAMGWTKEWDGPEEDFIDAKEFIRRQPLFQKISENRKQSERLSEELKQVKDSLNQLASHHQKVKEVEYQRALKTIREEKRNALKEGDAVRALELDDQIDVLTEQHKEEVVEIKQQAKEQQANGVSPEFLVWVKDHDWYLKDEDMHDFADGVAASYVQRLKIKGQSIVEQDVFNHVVEKVKKAYPEKFTNPNRERHSAVSGSERNGKSVKGSFSPSDEEKEVAKNFVKQGIYKTEQEYYKELQDIRENK